MSSKIYGAVLLLAIITCFAAADALHHDDAHLFSVRIVGTVFCDTCYKQQFSKNSYFISGASVAVECRNNKQTPDFRTEAKTNKYGQFKVELVPSIFHSDKQLKRCSVTLLQNEEQKSPCKLVSTANSSSFTLKSKKGSIHTYSAGFFSYRPQSPPSFCSQDVATDPKSALKASLKSSKDLLPPIPLETPPLVPLPPLPPVDVPSVPLPPLPPVDVPLVPLPPLPPVDVPLVPLPPLPPVDVPLVPLPPLPPVDVPSLVPLPPLPVPPLTPPA
ncbi:hypothetical protein SUGI_1024940 [Cryptomeria japonica]|uniref:uncharacterized protein LOC131040921 n=1 Tax=Cryptomeria japonica TaxID=3369 RepID=UPI0024147DBE|nr:uncharacterized protein LOC131040921 [Cryptomeria japonica]GLJ48586.1 hypothetical protein SUGI_1024940 [Cryptomeria japonica]